MKKINTAAAWEMGKIEGQRLTVRLDSGRPANLILCS